MRPDCARRVAPKVAPLFRRSAPALVFALLLAFTQRKPAAH